MSASTGGSVIVAGARTPIGRLLGGLKDQSAADLGGVAIKGALEKAGVSGDQVEYVIMGQVIQAGAGQITARQAAVKGGIPMTVPSITINKVCLSGINAIAMADQLIRAGEHDIIVAGGMESMTQAPHLLPKSREGFKYGDTTLVDSMAYDALYDQFTDQAMGNLTETCNAAGANLTREEQDDFSAQSHQRAAEAWKNGLFDDEVVPVEIPQRKGDPVVVAQDEGVRGDTTAESLGKLRPVSKDGTITAGSASQISDGACAVVVMSKAKAEELGLTWLAEIGASGQVAGPRLHPPAAAGPRDRQGRGEGGHLRLRHRPVRAQRGLRRGRHRVGPPARRLRGQGQRQRRRDRPRPPGRHVRRPDRAAPRPRAQAPRWRHRCRRAVRWRRPGRRPDHPGARLGLSATRRGSLGGAGAAQRRRSPTWSPVPGTGDARAVARLISLVEDASPLLREVMAALAPHTGNAQVVGITGSPGVGKSTSTSALVTELRRAGQARRRARGRPVLAVLGRRAARRPGADAGPRAGP